VDRHLIDGGYFEMKFAWARTLPDNEWVAFLAGEKLIGGQVAPPMPPIGIQMQFVGASGAAALAGATCFFHHVRAVLADAEAPWTPTSRVLDLGVGWGRLYRYLLREIGHDSLIGADIDGSMIDICRDAMPWGRFLQIPVSPPYNFQPGSFDIVYLYSVFSHLNERNVVNMLEECARILTRSGFVFFTTLSETHLEVWDRQTRERGTPMAHFLHSADFDLSRWSQKAKDGSFIYLPVGGDDVRSPDFYGLTILTRAFLQKTRVIKNFQIVQFESHEDMPQVFVALRRL
jgi:SAM-dependent methyltransferase